MFQNFAHKLVNLNLGTQFYTSIVTDMSNMFNGCGQTEMTTLTLGDNFNTSQVTNMSGMFQDLGKTNMQSLDLGDTFYTTSVTDMTNMFNGCGQSAMTVLDLGPAFTKVADSHDNFMTNCGTSELIIYAPEAIYSDRMSAIQSLLVTQICSHITGDEEAMRVISLKPPAANCRISWLLSSLSFTKLTRPDAMMWGR